MSSHRSGKNPTLPPTSKRIADARKKGNVAKSNDLTSSIVFCATVLALFFFVPWIGQTILSWFEQRILYAAEHDQIIKTSYSWIDAMLFIGKVTMPVVVIAFFSALIAGYIQIGPLLTFRPLELNFERINFISGLKRLISPDLWFDLAKSLLKIVCSVWIVSLVLSRYIEEASRLSTVSIALSMRWIERTAFHILIGVMLFYLVTGVGDYFWQKYRHRHRLKMTHEEIKREHREMEGDPHHRAHRQRLHKDLLQHQMITSVKDADCIIVNPDHVSVAIRYDRENMHAPIVMASGYRLTAKLIKDVARQYDVPIYLDVPLARALVDTTPGEAIPEVLYEAVAVVLQFVYGMNEKFSDTIDQS